MELELINSEHTSEATGRPKPNIRWKKLVCPMTVISIFIGTGKKHLNYFLKTNISKKKEEIIYQYLNLKLLIFTALLFLVAIFFYSRVNVSGETMDNQGLVECGCKAELLQSQTNISLLQSFVASLESRFNASILRPPLVRPESPFQSMKIQDLSSKLIAFQKETRATLEKLNSSILQLTLLPIEASTTTSTIPTPSEPRTLSNLESLNSQFAILKGEFASFIANISIEPRENYLHSRSNKSHLSIPIEGQDSEDDDERLDPAVSLQSFEEFKNFTKDFQKVFVEDMTKLKNTFLELQIKIAVGRKGAMSCFDYFNAGIKDPGTYTIDPDGGGDNNQPFDVFCKDDGTTVLHHDGPSQAIIPDTCKTAKCFTWDITYPQTASQIRGLISTSKSCKQYIRFDCISAPLEKVGFWFSMDGSQHDYFDGDDDGEHACKCFKADNHCSGNPWHKKCYCDIPGMNRIKFDEGYITRLDHLPIGGFSYQYLNGLANITIGDLECTGRKAVDANTCEGLRLEGLTPSGYYFFPSTSGNTLRVSRCNFTLPFGHPDVESQAGFVGLDIESSSFVAETGVNNGAMRWRIQSNRDWVFSDPEYGLFTSSKKATYLFAIFCSSLPTDVNQFGLKIYPTGGSTRFTTETFVTYIGRTLKKEQRTHYDYNYGNRYSSDYDFSNSFSGFLVTRIEANQTVQLVSLPEDGLEREPLAQLQFMAKSL